MDSAASGIQMPLLQEAYKSSSIAVSPLLYTCFTIDKKSIVSLDKKRNHSSGGWIPVRLVRHWIRGFLLNVKNREYLYFKGLENALKSLPDFSILFRSRCRALSRDKIEYTYKQNQRLFTLCVYIPSC